MASNDLLNLIEYVKSTKHLTDVLFTGGDPMVMKAHHLSRYMDTLINTPGTEHLKNIRIGTKSIAYWPYRYVTDDDADDVLRLFERICNSGRHLSLMAHFTHW